MLNPSTLDPLSLPSLPLEQRSQLPTSPCIYFAIDSRGVVQCIGGTGNLQKRWLQHHRYKQLKNLGSISVAYLSVDKPALLREIEDALIAWFNPPLNGSAVVGEIRRVSLCLEEDLKEKLERLAKARKRSLSNLIETCMEEIAKQAEKSGELEGEGDRPQGKKKD